ncbi:hypothetical protein ACA758_03375 [Mycoplasmopsis agassizii]|uniref:hypothetical protein n=1 Tax=Mycoplasmopsis agassizii TaxID=33922 RepID=UPI0035284708
MDIINELMPQKEFKDFLIQKGYPNYLKSISLVTDQESLKKQLRLNDEDQKKHNTYLERIEGKTLTTAELAKLKPWSESFNQQTIESKLTLKNHDYLFVKDLWEYFSPTAIRVSRVEAGIELLDYRIDIENKTIKMKAGFVAEKFCSNCGHNARAVYAYPPKTTSFLIPVEKGKITDFNMNEWNIILTEGDL